MATYKVPQDVEAEDKLIGPFSFRQFIYLIIAAIGILLAWGLARIFVGLLVIPLPLIAFFLIIALPLRKDQPMETYLAAVIRFFLKPRQRLWVPEGTISLVNITVPKTIEQRLTKNFSGSQASAQLTYLAQVMDTQGWATRGVMQTNSPMNDTVFAEAQATEDILDDNTNMSRNFDQRIALADQERRETMLQQFQQAARQPAPAPQAPIAPANQFVTPAVPITATAPSDIAPVATAPADTSSLSYNPYPSSMHQRVLSPAGTPTPQATAPAPAPIQETTDKPSVETVSPDIIRLANDKDLSISTLAHEAHRLIDETKEVEISLR